MTWYTAHAITWVRFKAGAQDCFPVQEDLLLISADTHGEDEPEAS